MVNLELYRVFYTVARCGSLTKAAEELYISQPAVSQAIKQLENQLGTPLFNRMHKGMELSAQGGELIFADIEKALQLLSGVEDRLSELKKSATGTLRIGASETIFQYVLADKIVEYHKLYPQVKIDLISDVSPKIIDCLKSDRCDIGFLNLPIEPDDGIRLTDSVALLDDVFVAGEAFAELKGKQLSVWDLQQYPLLLMEPHTIARAAVDHYAESLGVHFQPAVEVDSWGFMKKLVTEGMGIGCIPREYAMRRLEAGCRISDMGFEKVKQQARRFRVARRRKAVSFLGKRDQSCMRKRFLCAFAVRDRHDLVFFAVQDEDVAGKLSEEREGVEPADTLEKDTSQFHAPKRHAVGNVRIGREPFAPVVGNAQRGEEKNHAFYVLPVFCGDHCRHESALTPAEQKNVLHIDGGMLPQVTQNGFKIFRLGKQSHLRCFQHFLRIDRAAAEVVAVSGNPVFCE